MEKASDWLHTCHRSVITDPLHGTFWVQAVECSFLSGLYQERRPNVLQKSDGYFLIPVHPELEKHSASADLRQAAPFPHTMIPTKRTVLYLFHFYEPSLKSL